MKKQSVIVPRIRRRRAHGSRTTISDVARFAEVNIATVSRVLRKPEVVRGITRERVEKAIRLLNYCPNPYARALSSRRTGAIAYFIQGTDALNTLYHSQIIGRFEAALQGHDRDVLIVSAASVESLAQRILSVMADAFVLHGWHLSPQCLDAIRQRRCPTVFFECNFSAGDLPQDHHIGSVRLNYSKVGQALTSELIGLGRKKIAFLDPGPSLDKSSVYLGYLSALRESSVVHDTRLAFSIGQGQPAGYDVFKRGQQACHQLLALGPKAFDGVIAAGDIHAAGFISELRRNGLRVPEDVAVFSINDSLHCLCTEPQLSAAWFDTEKIAEAVLTQLRLAEQQADHSHPEILLDPEFHRRGSTHSIAGPL